jgi:hypothetical protein
MIQAGGHRVPPRGRRAQDSYRSIDGAGDCGAGLAGANIKRPDNDALADLTGSILASPRNYIGKGIQRTKAQRRRWRLKEAAS